MRYDTVLIGFMLCCEITAGLEKGRRFTKGQFLSTTAQITKEELGLALIPDKLLATSTENILQSVFMKVAAPRPPEKVCELPCTPDMEKVTAMTDRRHACWIEKLIPAKSSILERSDQDFTGGCLARCLLNPLCGLLSFDSSTGTCFIQTPFLYNLNAIDEHSNSISARLDCLLEEHQTTRKALCQNENPLFEAVLQSMLQAQNSLVEMHMQKFEDIKFSYDLNVTSDRIVSRRKRGLSWEAFDPLGEVPVIGYFYQLLKAPSENKRIKEHLGSLERRFYDFAHQVVEGFENTRTFHMDVLQIIDSQLSSIYEQIAGLQCDITSLASLMVYQQSLIVHQSKLNRMFFSTAHGKLSSTIAQTLTLNDLKLIARSNPNFEGTLYKTNPEVLYRVADLILLKVDHHENNVMLFHFLLVAPKLVPGSLHRTYNAVKIPITSSKTSSTCFHVSTPDSIIYKNKKFFEVDLTDCTTADDIIYCHQEFEDRFSPSIKELPCLNDKISSCDTIPLDACETKMVFTKAGALVFSQVDVLAMPKNETTKLVVASVPEKSSYFFQWSKYRMIQCQQNIMYALDNSLTVRNLTEKTNEINLDLIKYLKIREIQYHAQNISILSDRLENTTQIALQDYQPNYLGLGASKKKFFEWTSLFSTIVTFTSIVGLIGLVCYKRLKKNSTLLQTVLAAARQERELKRLRNQELTPITPSNLEVTNLNDEKSEFNCTEIVPLRARIEHSKFTDTKSKGTQYDPYCVQSKRDHCRTLDMSSTSSSETVNNLKDKKFKANKPRISKIVGPFLSD